ncbi:MAG: aminoacetone oxidase family FAD-binding enzyme [Lachnospiraceae bacterium]|nr:aminoacetone oxidase family FAD-binding enzyme [Lachnospiraceae bacterium]
MTSWKIIPADRYEVAVVGGGAAGMTAAIAAARSGARVVLLERGDRPGKKILMTGNGKCNLGNRDLKASDYYSDNMAVAASVLERFGTEETIAFFASLGLMVREKRGYLYPVSEQAAVVLDVLRYGLKREGVTVLTQAMVQKVIARREDSRTLGEESCPPGYVIRLGDGRELWAQRVILACGGQAAPKTGSDGSGYGLAKALGHRIVSPVPSLVQLHCGEKYCKALAGVRAEGTVRIYREKELHADLEETGEIQLTEFGISGIPVFQLSGSANQLLAQGEKLRAELDFFPQYGANAYEELCRLRLKLVGRESVETFFTGMLHKKIMGVCIRLAGLSPEQEAAKAGEDRLRQVFSLCRRLPFTITGSHSFDSAQVCRGGVSMEEVDCQLQSLRSPGLYLAGELLHVDGRCGGYNLQWAWASGHIAGEAACAGKIKDRGRKEKC